MTELELEVQNLRRECEKLKKELETEKYLRMLKMQETVKLRRWIERLEGG